MNHSLWILLLLAMACDPGSEERSRDNPGNESMELAATKDSLSAEAKVEEPQRHEEIGELERRLIAAGLVDIQEVIPEVRVELKYATTDNFFGKNVYGSLSRCYMQPEVAEMLEEAYQELSVRYPELTFLIYDAVRPQSVQQILWDELDKPDSLKPLYVADPMKGSLHNFGVAIDLTLASKETGDPLDMGTGYDYFGYPAYPDREDQMLQEGRISEEQVANRKILREVMKKAGFTGIGSEWWHFNAYSRKVAGEKFDIVK
ncbi:M15 family metallopeptidase [Cyclobacterium jeungdonense]|uniref:D-alanyl-D-alanine dipeptidase n=1 Tax=Cyclobacterium jeungdonense TaxID=708087 RepID=A0ABT8CBP6_9BACT|nr:M15 family metallopeptidase [Cyclobacterium jeungdonense]MDN3689008.1 M15 family metallopeptidase [Cyclobacterium jeungdonense]